MADVLQCYVLTDLKVVLVFSAQRQSVWRVVVVHVAFVAELEHVRDLVVLLDTRFAPQLSSPLFVGELK